MDARNDKLAKVLIDYSCTVDRGDRLLVEAYGFEALPLVGEITRIATQKGAFVFHEFRNDAVLRELLLHADEAQIKAQAKYPLYRMKDMDCFIGIRASANVAELSDVPAEKTKWYARHYRDPIYSKVCVPNTRWVGLSFPNHSMAQRARMPLARFQEFYYKVCTMDYAKMSRAMNPLKRLIDRTDEVVIKGPGTDLRFSIKGMGGIKCDGKNNIPDGECFTAPVLDSVEGFVRFNAGSLLDGMVFGDINLEFKKGRVVRADAGADTEKLKGILGRDSGANYVGEFAFGFNPYIRHAMLDILFDEKIAGSFHMALGEAYDECDNGNRSCIHWDLIQIQTLPMGGGEIWFDGKLIRKNGKFVPKALQGLNLVNLK